ncbi:hypothetical protein PBY51_017217 [Eleginops maclovinus]|uniref:Uncharacterized protein n=1 Tax=Eleginops maclovinus TaxID=56733 RepID=A0AAN8AMJ3_ELEMC|nr:hypothetical protein PBY51_017217 [Eleginops maclovinus]
MLSTVSSSQTLLRPHYSLTRAQTDIRAPSDMMEQREIELPEGRQTHQGYSRADAAPPVDLHLAEWTAVEKADQ